MKSAPAKKNLGTTPVTKTIGELAFGDGFTTSADPDVRAMKIDATAPAGQCCLVRLSDGHVSTVNESFVTIPREMIVSDV